MKKISTEIDKNLEEKFGKEFSKLSKEERERIILDSPRTTFSRLQELHVKITCLIDFINILGDLDSKYFKINYNLFLKERNENPGVFLNEYVISEISNFYTIVYLEKNEELPEPPEYWKKLKEFRNVVPGHADKEGEFKTYGKLKDFYKLMDEIGLGKILQDYNNYFIKCAEIFLKLEEKEKMTSETD